MPAPITAVRQISRIACGFIGSKALFPALKLDMFGRLAAGGRSFEDLVIETGIAANGLQTLLAAPMTLGLVSRDQNGYRNAPASEH